MTGKRIVLICLIGLLLVAPVCAKEITSKVDDKEIVDCYGETYSIHTVKFGDISVLESTYQKVMINDTITFDTKSDFGLYTVLQVNGVDLE